ncbi:MAG: alpha/beta fold hydrolase [Haloarculaceae archaeon]
MAGNEDADRLNPFAVPLRFQEQAVDLALGDLRRASVLPDRLADGLAVDVGETPSRVVHTENKLELLQYESLTEDQHPVPILIVYALINRPSILDLQPDRSIVRRLLEAGHDVYLIDWNEPSRLDRHLGLADYVTRYIDNAVDVIRDRSGAEAINLLGYCMGGTLSVIYTALFGPKVNALGLLAPALYFEDTGGVLERWGEEADFDPRTITETYGNVPGEVLAGGFAAMDPVANYVTKYVHLLDRVENEDFVRNFGRMEQWLADDVDVAGAAYAEFVEELYQENSLLENELTLDGQPVDVTSIDVPILQVLGEYDSLVPPAASTPLNDVVASEAVTTIEYPRGHVGLAMSSGAHRDVWPEVAEWYLEHSRGPTFAEILGDGVERALEVDVETDVTEGGAGELEIGLADAEGEIAREVVAQDPGDVQAFLEEALDVDIGLEVGPDGIVVEVESADGARRTVVESVGEAIRSEVEEAVADVDIAARHDLEDVSGIGPTYAGRLRAAGIETVGELAVADPEGVAEAAKASQALAEGWIEEAVALVGTAEPRKGSG